MTYLFSAAFIDPKIVAEVRTKGDLVLRPLHSEDYKKGFLQVLSQLTKVGQINENEFKDIFSQLLNRNDQYFTIVIEDRSKEGGRICGSGTVLIERKFVHHGGLVGHIEDIVVSDSGYRGLNLGRFIIEALKGLAARAGAYKVILDCAEKNVKFYEKCGFTRKEVEMAWYVPGNDRAEGEEELVAAKL